MTTGRRKAGPDPRDVPLAWAIACDLRQVMSTARFTKWPQDQMTNAEKKTAARLNRLLSDAEDEIRTLQGSLSERSRMLGFENPDYKRARGEV